MSSPTRRASKPTNKRMPNSTRHETNVENDIDMSDNNHDFVGISDPYLIMATNNQVSGGHSQPNQHTIILQEHLLIHDQQQLQQNQQIMQEEASSLSPIPDHYALRESHQIGQDHSNVSIDHSSIISINKYMFLPKSTLSNYVNPIGGKKSSISFGCVRNLELHKKVSGLTNYKRFV